MPAVPYQQGKANIGSNATGTTTTTTPPPTAPTPPVDPSASIPNAKPTLSERDLIKIEFYKTYDPMVGIRIAATLGSFFGLMVIMVIYKSRSKKNRQLNDPRLTAAAEAAVAEAEAEEALAAALEARLNHGRRSLCPEQLDRFPLSSPRFSSIGGGYDAFVMPPLRRQRRRRCSRSPPEDQRRYSSVTCSSTGSSYLERRESATTLPYLPPPPSYPRHAPSYEEPWDRYHHIEYPIDIQVTQPTPDISPCDSEAGLYTAGAITARALASGKRAPLASMTSVDPPEPDTRSLGSDSVFINDEDTIDTEDEVSGFSTDSEVTGSNYRQPQFLRVPPSSRRLLARWDGCESCVPRRRPPARSCRTCLTISATIETQRPRLRSTISSSSSSTLNSPPHSPPIELRERPSGSGQLPESPPPRSQETLF
ncbi:uncharacterized protein LOC122504799 isoform X1 [Leptopilina heterotoma]|uniref:uncharacterized protein LOC122504799 isoform X1 n=2 Tax=Leptopilina heterotoma TaxID=63436 RepID=UPI001CA99C5B|nr:uncharacterized protein LOC122504799 isoform X1 [Leptopilina heterotoma]